MNKNDPVGALLMDAFLSLWKAQAKAAMEAGDTDLALRYSRVITDLEAFRAMASASDGGVTSG